MKIRWCWRCKSNLPMLDKEEFNLCRAALVKGKERVEQEIQDRNLIDYQWVGDIPKSYEKFRYFIDMYRVLTGFDETNPNAIWHHRIEDFGEDCPSCKKPLRTKQARYCAACGFGKEDFTSQDTTPLVERKSHLFDL